MLKTTDMSNTLPDEKTVITYMTYLCARLLSIRNEQHAASVIQLAWRRYRARCQHTRGGFMQSVTTHGYHEAQMSTASDETEAAIDLASTDQLDAVSADSNQKLQSQSIHDGSQDAISNDMIGHQSSEVEPDVSVAERMIDVVDYKVVNDMLSLPDNTSSDTGICLNFEPSAAVADCEANVAKSPGGLLIATEESASEGVGFDSVSEQDGVAKRQLLQRQEDAALCIQLAYRRHVARRVSRDRQRAVQSLHRLAVAYLHRQRFRVVHAAAITLQAAVRGHQSRQHYLSLRGAICHMQAMYRGRVSLRRYQTVRSAVITIQALARGYLARKKLSAWRLHREEAVIRLQAVFRGYCQRQKYRLAVEVAVSLGLLTSKQHVLPPPCNLLQCLLSAAQNGMPRDKVMEATQNLAAMKIQTAFAAWRYRRRRAAIITLQRTLRTLPHRFHFKQLRRAAVTIQTTWRGKRLTRIARLNLLNHIGAAMVIQSVVRMFLCRSRYLRLCRAIIAMQSRCRQLKQLERNHSATVIQSAVRMFILRNKFLKMRQAAVQIQTLHRCKVQQARFVLMKSNAVIIQRWFRHQLQLRRCRAALKIQSFVRMVSVRHHCHSILQKVVTVQSLARSFLAQQKFLSLRRSAVTIQQRWRGKMLLHEARVRHAVMVGAAIAIQAAFRGYLQRNAYITMRTEHWAAVKMQKIFRGYCARQNYAQQVKAVLLLQAGCRAAIARLRLRRQTSAAVVIQRAVRKLLAQRQYQKRQKHIVKIQSICRGYLVRLQLRRKQDAAAMIQKIYRGLAARRQFRHQYRSIVCLQACVRSFLVRRRLEEKHKACTKIQSVDRKSVV